MIQERLVVLFIRSLGMASAVSLISFCIAIPLTTIFQNRTGILQKRFNFLRWLLVSLILIPPYIHALAWMDFLARFSSLIRQIGFNWSAQGIALSTWIWVMALLPCAIGISILSIESVQPDLFQAARILHSDLSGFIRVTLPLAAPGLLAGFGFILLLCLLDYSVASLFGVPVYALEIFADYSANGQAGRAVMLSIPLLLVALLWIIIMIKILRPASQTPVMQAPVEGQVLQWPPVWKRLQGLSVFIIFLEVCVPLVSLMTLVGSFGAFGSALQTSWFEVGFSFSIALLTCLFSVAVGIFLSDVLQQKNRLAGWSWVGVLIPFLTPAPLIGILLVELQNMIPRFHDPGMVLPVLAAAIRFSSLAVIVLAMQRRRINPSYIEAASILERNSLKNFWHVILPLLIPGVFVAIGLVFSLTLGELGATLMVISPGNYTLALKIYNYLHYGASDQVASLSLFMMFMTASIVGLCFRFVQLADHIKAVRIEADGD